MTHAFGTIVGRLISAMVLKIGAYHILDFLQTLTFCIFAFLYDVDSTKEL